MKNTPPKKITLHQFAPALGVRNPSSPCLKLETWLKIASIDYDIKLVSDPRKAPKGKVPWVTIDGTEMGDSRRIISYLSKATDKDPDKNLSDAEKAQNLAFTSLIDDRMYFTLLYQRWARDDFWAVLEEGFFGKLPFILKLFVPKKIRAKQIKKLHMQGTASHNWEEILEMGDEDFKALSDILGDKTYFGGKKPTSLDASAYSILANSIECNIDCSLSKVAKKYKNLVDYVKRMTAEFYS